MTSTLTKPRRKLRMQAGEPCPRKSDPRPENRVVGSGTFTSSCTWSTWSQTPDTHREIETASTTTVSGALEWLSKDPIGISGGLIQYVFCGNNPVNRRDPLGLCEKKSPGPNLDTLGKAYGFMGGSELIGIGTQIAIKGFPEVGPWSFVGAAPFWLSGGALWWASAGGPDLVTPVVDAKDRLIDSLPRIPDPVDAAVDFIENDMRNHGYDPSDSRQQYDYWYDGFTGTSGW